MVKLEFKKNWIDLFRSQNLDSFESIFGYSNGQIINQNQKRDVVELTLGTGMHRKELFMKRFIHPHFKDILFTIRNFGRICSQAECEWLNANTLLSKDFMTYKPVCYGYQTICGIEIKSFIITEKIRGEALTDFAAKNWGNIPKAEQEEIFIDLGKLVRKIHDSKISLPDLYLWHILLSWFAWPGNR